MSLLVTKLTLALGVFLAGWAGGAIALKRAQTPGGGSWLSLGNAFAAGVFLGTGLIHMLSEATAGWRELGGEYPVPFVLAAAAFALILLFEHVLLPDDAHAMIHAHTGEPLGHLEHHHSGHTHRTKEAVSPYALVIALSAHSVIAGLALGAQPTITSAWIIAVAILAHKATAGLALGMNLAGSRLSSSRSHRFVLLFAVMTPLGILAGMALSGVFRSDAEAYFDATVSALAAGTFLYIASIDMLQDEFLKPGSRWAKWIWAVIGLTLTAVLAIWV
ncbi:MAG: ZIP family metal transporter [Acidobacteriota bacterium]|nr:ZIP family metal transporter [Acidobacteriota bacterium]